MMNIFKAFLIFLVQYGICEHFTPPVGRNQLFYQAEGGELLGPFPFEHVAYWYNEGFLNPNTLVTESPSGPFQPITAVIEDILRPSSEWKYGGTYETTDQYYDEQYQEQYQGQDPCEGYGDSADIGYDQNLQEQGDEYSGYTSHDDDRMRGRYEEEFQPYPEEQSSHLSNDKKKSIWHRLGSKISRTVLKKIPLRRKAEGRQGPQRASMRQPTAVEQPLQPPQKQDGRVNYPQDIQGNEMVVDESHQEFEGGPYEPADEEEQSYKDDGFPNVIVQEMEIEAVEESATTGISQGRERPQSKEKRYPLSNSPAAEQELEYFTFMDEQRDEDYDYNRRINSLPSPERGSVGVVSVRSLQNSVDEIWGNDKRYSSVLPPDIGGRRVHHRFFLFNLLGSMLQKNHSLLKYFLSGVYTAPIKTLLLISAIIMKLIFTVPTLGVFSFMVEQVFTRSFFVRSASASDINGVHQLSPELLLKSYPKIIQNSIQSLINKVPIMQSVFHAAALFGHQLLHNYRPFLPILGIISIYYYLSILLQPSISKSFLKRVSRSTTINDNDDNSAVYRPLLAHYCTELIGHYTTLVIFATVAWNFGCIDISNSLLLALGFGLVEFSLIKTQVNIPSKHVSEYRMLLNNYQKHASHLNSLVTNRSPDEQLKADLTQTMSDIKQRINNLVPRIPHGLFRKWLQSVILLWISFRSYIGYAYQEASVLKGYNNIVQSLAHGLKLLYFRYGIELIVTDDSVVARRIETLALILAVFLPSFILSQITEICTRIHQMYSLIPAEVPMAESEDIADIYSASHW